MDRPGHSSRPWQRVRKQILADSDICWICGHPGADTIDHIVPVSQGGAYFDRANLRPACSSCNKRKGNGTRRRRRPPPSLMRNSRQW